MTNVQIVLAVATFCAAGTLCRASDSVEEKLHKIAQLGPGVHEIQNDAQGHIRSCVVVARTPFSSEVAKSLTCEDACQRAEIDAIAHELGEERELQGLQTRVIRDGRVYLIVVHWEAPKAQPLKHRN
jgi:hypothetical protein